MSIVKRIFLFLLAVLVSACIWVIVTNKENPVITRRFSDIPVKLENADAYTDLGYTYSVKENEDIDLIVKGRTNLVSSLTEKDFSVIADFNQLSQMNAIPIVVTTDYGDRLDVKVDGSGVLQIESEKSEEKKFPVVVDTEGLAADGYLCGKDVVSSPNIVTISGPESVIKNIKNVKAVVNLSDVMKDVSVNCNLKVYDKDDKEIVNDQVVINPLQVMVEIPVFKTKTVPIILHASGSPKDGYKKVSFTYHPDMIELYGNADVLDDIEEIDFGDFSIDGKKETHETNFMIKDDMLPDGVSLVDDNRQLKVQCEIEKEKD